MHERCEVLIVQIHKYTAIHEKHKRKYAHVEENFMEWRNV